MIIDLGNGDYITTQELRDLEHEPEPDPDEWYRDPDEDVPADEGPVEYSNEPPF
jgi:hypothetical protein